MGLRCIFFKNALKRELSYLLYENFVSIDWPLKCVHFHSKLRCSTLQAYLLELWKP